MSDHASMRSQSATPGVTAQHLASHGPATDAVAEGGLATQLHLVVGVWSGWALAGLLVAVALRRRGYEFGPAAAIGAVLGPLFLPLARRDLASTTNGRDVILVEPPRDGGGQLDVFVAVDGTGSVTSIAPSLEHWVGTRPGRLMIGGAIDHESARTGRLSNHARRIAHEVEVAALMLEPTYSAGRVLVGGAARDTLPLMARDHGYDVIIVCSGRADTRSWRRALGGDAPLVSIAPSCAGETVGR